MIELRIKCEREIHYKPESMWGMFGVVPITNQDEVVLNRFGNMSIRGVTKKLKEGYEYDVVLSTLQKNSNPKYDDYYEIIEVKPERLDTVDDQQVFLRALVTQNQANALISAYPNEKIIDLIVDNKVDTSKTRGIKQKTLEKIRETIIENREMESLVALLKDVNITFNAIKKVVTHYGTVSTALQKINETMYNLTEVPGFGFTKVDNYALEHGEDLHSNYRIGSALRYILTEQGQDGHTWIDKDSLLQEAHKLLNIEQYIINEFLSEPSERTQIVTDEYERVSLKRYYNDELMVLLNLHRINQTYLSTELSSDIDKFIKLAEVKQGFTFTEEQSYVIKDSMKHGVCIINGKGGTGKTTILTGIAEILKEQGKSYVAVSLSGKAAQVLSQKGLNAMTIHRALKAKGLSTFEFNKDNPMPYDVIILDEASMVNAGMLRLLVSAIRNGAKIIIVGDSGQLSGIGHGDILRDLRQTELFPVYELKQIHRQASGSGIIEVASKFREGEQIVNYNSTTNTAYGINEDQRVITFGDREVVPLVLKDIIDNYSSRIKSEQDLLDFQILAANRNRGELSVDSINGYAQTVFNDVNKPYIERGQVKFHQGDKVIAKGNSYKVNVYYSLDSYFSPIKTASPFDGDYDDIQEEEYNPNCYKDDVFNGTMGIVQAIDEKEKAILVKFQNVDGIVAVKGEDLNNVNLAYAISIHESQGSSIPHVVTVLDFVAYKLLSKQLAYTAITRASKKSILIAENNALYKAIQTDLSGIRRTLFPSMVANIDQLYASNKDRMIKS